MSEPEEGVNRPNKSGRQRSAPEGGLGKAAAAHPTGVDDRQADHPRAGRRSATGRPSQS